MFEWLEQEIKEVRTKGFHMVEGPTVPPTMRGQSLTDPPSFHSYREFVRRFGNARLYRLSLGAYTVGVFAEPVGVAFLDGSAFYKIGFSDSGTAYLRILDDQKESPVYEFDGDLRECDRVSGRWRKAADTFEDWLVRRCSRKRRQLGKRRWAEIVRGPKPFSEAEIAIVEARRQIEWRVVGINAEGQVVINIVNKSCVRLPVLLLGVRSRDGTLEGAVSVKIGHIGPGQFAVCPVNCYRNLVSAEEIEVFALPDPLPDTRDDYPELHPESSQEGVS